MKDIQGNMRHSRMSTTADIYVQDIPESRRRAVNSLPVPKLLQFPSSGTELVPIGTRLDPGRACK